MSYKTDTGPRDAMGSVIKEGDRIVVGSNSGVRVGKVIAVKTHERRSYVNNAVLGYSYSVTLMKELPTEGRQTFNHEVMGEEKFWVIS